jgi:ring-1,2-phenylacetyl-CoA epoxidase subunit PaaC
LKEVTYHLRHSTEWTYRLGDGTKESREKMQHAIGQLWRFTGDLFQGDDTDEELIREGIAVDLNGVKKEWDKNISEVLTKATLVVPSDTFMITGGSIGRHTEFLGHLLAEMQILPRSFPGADW